MTFYRFRQNNSGGRWVIDADRGISVEVWIEAGSPTEAILRAEEIGLYWDGVNKGFDCSCCGDRWWWSVSGVDYDARESAPPTVFEPTLDISSLYPDNYGYIHFADGRIVGITIAPGESDG